jgi:hypothetical protein
LSDGGFERYGSYVLHVCTAIFLVTLGLVSFTAFHRSAIWDERISEEGAERNERSTPRAFILPATPAVAEEQERQARDLRDGVHTFRCLQTLRTLGYDADDAPPALRARNLEAILRFQRDRGMKATGRLDRDTVTSLRCQ